MGITRQVAQAMFLENSYKPILGEYCSFGKQTVSLSQESYKEIFDIDFVPAGKQLDGSTRHAQQDIEFHRAKEEEFLNIFCNVNYNCLDISDYEGANIIFDLNKPITPELQNRFDFVFTGGCHDNIHDPKSVLVNGAKMLKTGGRIMHYEAAQGLTGAYLYFTAEWFYSYYAVNKFADCKVYLLHQVIPGNSRLDYRVNLYEWKPDFERDPNYDYFKAALSTPGLVYILVIAEKDSHSTTDQVPIQLQYLSSSSIDWREQKHVFNATKRPKLNGKMDGAIQPNLPYNSDHYVFCGSEF
ncbi:MAG: hypothetical protein RJQ14_09860 [Marinoscillum sp.]